ncbi:MAG: glycerophosphodiester phosphodiesterase [Acidimicrobiia bacterium]|nr:glycerophosphodiester phosphodiesterase [Acidimicrobiia bacterium]MCY4456639.1 glycerophosphodiester phosphodiesterase [Acidimicrobiaceae bacterium]
MTQVIAHRGASQAAQENTLIAFRLAQEMGADWVELDARRAADGVVVVHHDAHLPDGRILADVSSEELPDYIPSLAEALEVCESMNVNIEIKNLPSDPDYDQDHLVVYAVAGLVQAYLGVERALITSFNIDAVQRIRSVDPSLRCGWVLYEMTDPASAIGRALAHEMDTIHPWDVLVDSNFVKRAHQAGLQVYVWAVDQRERIAELTKMGVDGICTNVPDLARKVIDELGA